MITQQLLKKIKKPTLQKIGKSSMVVFPLAMWRELEDSLEELEMEHARTLPKKIARARKGKRSYSLSQTKKLLGV